MRRQTEATEVYCAKHGLTLADDFKLLDAGKSGYHGDHRKDTGALGLLEKIIDAGKIPLPAVLIVENLDRLTREDIVTAQLLFLNLINKGLEIVALMDNERLFTKESIIANPMELVMSIMVMMRGHEESKTKSNRIKSVWFNRREMASKGKAVSMSLKPWLEFKDGKYVVIDSKVKTIRHIVRLYIQGYGTMAIAKMLNRDCIPNIARANKRYTNKWKAINIYRLLKHKELIGYYTGSKPETSKFFPAVISEADFYVCQGKLAERKRFKGQRTLVPNVFAHLLKCSKCGQGVTIRNKANHVYLQCRGNNETFCKAPYIKYHPMEYALLSCLDPVH